MDRAGNLRLSERSQTQRPQGARFIYMKCPHRRLTDRNKEWLLINVRLLGRVIKGSVAVVMIVWSCEYCKTSTTH